MKLFNKKNTEMVVCDKIANTREIDVADLKQYITEGYNEIRAVKQQKKYLEERLEEEQKNKHLYNSTLVVLEEYKKRDEENKNEINFLKERYKKEQEKNYVLQEQINNYTISLETLQNESKQLEKEITKKVKDEIENIKEKICEKIQRVKGNISKNQVCKIIRED